MSKVMTIFCAFFVGVLFAAASFYIKRPNSNICDYDVTESTKTELTQKPVSKRSGFPFSFQHDAVWACDDQNGLYRYYQDYFNPVSTALPFVLNSLFWGGLTLFGIVSFQYLRRKHE